MANHGEYTHFGPLLFSSPLARPGRPSRKERPAPRSRRPPAASRGHGRGRAARAVRISTKRNAPLQVFHTGIVRECVPLFPLFLLRQSQQPASQPASGNARFPLRSLTAAFQHHDSQFIQHQHSACITTGTHRPSFIQVVTHDTAHLELRPLSSS
ncbi:Hypothetical predicted protein [Cloeon dipterum]|uniref:Uncharacterized protein n=1 Tax=Cloeon dipterum TaxID=197152 RepID=A0A8S1DZJ5_9INSE|nr:Hypothetical predicted protein [Cloeon dipterum]